MAKTSGSKTGSRTDISFTYGLALTNNSKTGWAFSLPETNTCIGATTICQRLCYGRGIRYQSAGQISKRERNWLTIEHILSRYGVGSVQLLTGVFLGLIDSVRPLDYFSAMYTETRTTLPWTMRIHDVGDFYRADYVLAWLRVVQARHDGSFWFYTRSFVNDEVCSALNKLVALPNCQGWLSLDRNNYKKGLVIYRSYPGWKIAVLQDQPAGQSHDCWLEVVATAGLYVRR